MTMYIEDFEPVVKNQGLNTLKASNLAGVTIDTSGNAVVSGTLAVTGAQTFTGAITPNGGIAAGGGFTLNARSGFHTGGTTVTQTTDGNDTAVVTTTTYYAAVFIPANMTLTGIAVFNGSAAGNGHVAVALANSAGVVVANSNTTTTGVGTDAFQLIAFSSTYAAKGPSTYYVMVQGDSTSDKLNTHIVGAFIAGSVTSGTYGTFATLTPATTFTTAVGPLATVY